MAVCFVILAGMSIKLTLSIGTVKTEASLKDSAHNELMQFIFKHQEGASSPSGKPPEAEKINPALSDSDPVKGWIVKHTASEVLSRIGWETNPEKILLLAAFHEASGGKEGWRSADINERFKQAKEPFPANFPRDIRTAVEAGLIGTVTSRTYRVGRTGWNKIAEAIAKIP
jgi:hypothetical protein